MSAPVGFQFVATVADNLQATFDGQRWKVTSLLGEPDADVAHYAQALEEATPWGQHSEPKESAEIALDAVWPGFWQMTKLEPGKAHKREALLAGAID